ncbi:MAG: DUF4255 domain-containing protein [Methylocystis sp.]|uniref:DUF4255 domain-containing protein n=1 Tax=Methylocystis sp. TaxID=1911079 RepID=UPI003DA66865
MMSGYEAIALAGETAVRCLKTAFEADPPLRAPVAPFPPRKVQVLQVSPRELEDIANGDQNTLTLLLYRIDVNRAMRAGFAAVRGGDGKFALALDLFYLLTAWSKSAFDEQLMLGRAMQALAEASPLSGASTIGTIGAGRPEVDIEPLSMIIDELSNEAMMRIFDAFPVKYRLSVPYIGRLARICVSDVGGRLPVVRGDITLSEGASP